MYKWHRSHDQGGCHAHMVKTLESLQNRKSYDLETWHQLLELYKVCINGNPGLTTYFMATSSWVVCVFEWEKLLQTN